MLPACSYVFLLYPSTGGWPPEIDFAEDAGTHHRKETMQTLHYGSQNKQIHKFTRSNFTAWHTVGVDWTSTTLTYTLDGKVISRVKHTGVPNEKMWLGMQTQVIHPTAKTPKTVDVQIDWVARYRHR